MIFLTLLLLGAVVLAADTLRILVRDGLGVNKPPVSHLPDHDFLPPVHSWRTAGERSGAGG